jgi:hypothetical protein
MIHTKLIKFGKINSANRIDREKQNDLGGNLGDVGGGLDLLVTDSPR